jgi:four helix bundle protein
LGFVARKIWKESVTDSGKREKVKGKAFISDDEVEGENITMETAEGKDESNVKVDAIREKSFAFAVRIVKLCKYLEKNSDVPKSVVNQLLKAGTSIGANLEEAVAGQTKADFVHKNAISLKEARESNYWLRLILATSNFDEKVKSGIVELENESLSIAKIIGSIIVKSKKSK